MSTFEEYAALARTLSERRRSGERDAAAEAERLRGLHAAADQLAHRLDGQAQRLDQLGRTVGAPTTPAGSAAHPPGGTGYPPPPPGPYGVSPAGPPRASGAAGSGEPGAGRPAVGAYPEVTAGASRLALPGGADAAATGVPAPRRPDVDPAAELERARQAADEADHHGRAADALARQPRLLPTWSPLARAFAVYAACAGVGVLLMLVMVLGSGVGVVDLGTLYAWTCAGIPAVSMIAGYLLLGRYGQPAMVAGTPPRYPLVGFLVCFVLVPAAYCAYLVVLRGLR